MATAAMAVACGDDTGETGGSAANGGGSTVGGGSANGGASTNGGGSANGGESASGGAGGGAAVPGADLNGTWETGCFDTGFLHAKTRLTYTDLALVGNYSEFDDAACTSPAHSSDWTATATIAGTTANGETKIDIAFATFTSTPLTAANADTNNQYMYCGFSDWSANVEKDILGAPCMGFSIPVGGESLDIYTVMGDTLLFGANAKIGVDLMESDRPTTIDPQRVFTRQ